MGSVEWWGSKPGWNEFWELIRGIDSTLGDFSKEWDRENGVVARGNFGGQQKVVLVLKGDSIASVFADESDPLGTEKLMVFV